MEEDILSEGEVSEEKSEKEEKSISADLIRGHINTIILRALYDGDKYGYAIIAEIERKSHGQYSLKQPSLYSALKRLEKDGFVSSYWGGSVSGGRRKYFSLTDEGKAVAEQNQAEWEYSRTVIDSLISDKEFDFNNPAPTAVNMRVLRNSTSRIISSREDGSDDLTYEISFDDSVEREQLNAEYSQKLNELATDREALEKEKQLLLEEKNLFESEMAARNSAFLGECAWREKELAERERILGEQRQALEESKNSAQVSQLNEIAMKEELDRMNAEYEQKLAELQEKEQSIETEKQAFEADKKLYEEELSARNSAYLTEREWREKELAERERIIEEKRRALESYQVQTANDAMSEVALKEVALTAQQAQLEERIHAFEAEQFEQKQAFEEEMLERKRVLDEELESRKNQFEEEESERRRILEEEEATRRDALLAEEEAKRQSLAEEYESRMTELSTEMEARRKQLDDAEAHSRAVESQMQEQLRIREQQMRDRENYFVCEQARLSDEIRNRDETIASEREAHAKELEAQKEAILREQEILFRQREQQLIHQNYRDLVNTPPLSYNENTAYNYYAAPQQEVETEQVTPRDYRRVVQEIYANTINNESLDDGKAERVQPLDGIDFNDLESRAARDGIRINTTGGKAFHQEQEVSNNIVHKGKALFLSAIVVFFLCVIEGAVAFGMRSEVGLPVFYPYFIWASGLALLLVTGLAYANRYGERAIRRKTPALINAIVIYTLCAIITLIVALAVNIDFTSTSALATFVIAPIIYFFGIVVFGICYYILIRPKKD